MNTLPDNTLPNVNALYDDEIDLFELFSTLWEGKWLVSAIGFGAALIGLSASLWQPMYEGAAPIAPAHSSVFTKYLSVNEASRESRESREVFFDNEAIFDLFVITFNDYEALIEILAKTPRVQASVEGMTAQEREKFLIATAKGFKLIPPGRNETNWELQFTWTDAVEGTAIFNQAINDTLVKAQATLIDDMDTLANVVAIRQEKTMRDLNAQLTVLKEKITLKTRQRLLYLEEQATIARELNMAENALNGISLLNSQNIDASARDVQVNAFEVPFYLRGYKAIEKEIALLSARTEDEMLALNNDYVTIQEEIITLENDVTIEALNDAKVIIEAHTPYDWVRYDLSLAEIKPTKNPLLFVVLACLLGGMLGCIFVLIRSAMRNRRAKA